MAVQMKLTVEPTLTVRAFGSSTVTSMGLDRMSGERQREDSSVFSTGKAKR